MMKTPDLAFALSGVGHGPTLTGDLRELALRGQGAKLEGEQR